ncbi:acyltransferase [Luteimonas dalianensis]|uniref:acyltransferase n=1 Tax=Luteimonas dalianensis TaxID=1148196 RepID=UPI003BF29D9D
MLILKIRRRLAITAIRSIQWFRGVWYRMLSTNRVDGAPVRYQPVQAVGSGAIKCDRNVRIGVFPSSGFLDTYAYIEARSSTATVCIGENTWINNGFRCIAEHSLISIGANCLVGTNVEILDSDFHGLKLEDRNMSKPEWAAPVLVEDNVFIGSNVRILKGVRIGHGAVIANSSLVLADVPPMTIAGGVPAKVLRNLN